MRQAYVLVREKLRMAAKRNKRAYDLTLRPQTYSVGEWVRCYHPRKMAGRQDKMASQICGTLFGCQGHRASQRRDTAL